MELFNISKFKEYEKNILHFLFESLQLSYRKYFDLKSELVYKYTKRDFYLKSINCIQKLTVKD